MSSLVLCFCFLFTKLLRTQIPCFLLNKSILGIPFTLPTTSPHPHRIQIFLYPINQAQAANTSFNPQNLSKQANNSLTPKTSFHPITRRRGVTFPTQTNQKSSLTNLHRHVKEPNFHFENKTKQTPFKASHQTDPNNISILYSLSLSLSK